MSNRELERWESGSDFHFCENTTFLADPESSEPSADPELAYCISGRTALTSLVRLGMQQHGWSRIYFPSYYCHNVIDYVRQTGIETCYYPYNPFIDGNEAVLQVPDEIGTAMVCVNYFGAIRTTSHSLTKTTVIDDVTHDISSYRTSAAEYCFGSLRKELPVPVGGFFRARSFTAKPAVVHWPQGESVAALKLSAMYIKSRYLEGQADKDTYRRFFTEGEHMLGHCPHDAAMPLLARAVLSSLNTHAIAAAKQVNLSTASQLLDLKGIGRNGARIIAEGLGITLLCRHKEQRDLLKNTLISKNIFPAILWPAQIHERDREIESRILFVHLDYRYELRDVEKIIHCINHFFAL